jgi:hypothetical protein
LKRVRTTGDHQRRLPPNATKWQRLPLPHEPESSKTSHIVKIFKDIQEGKDTGLSPWSTYQLAPGEYEEIERQIDCDPSLRGYVDDKLRCVALDDE